MSCQDICEDLIQMARKARFRATWHILEHDHAHAAELLQFAEQCQEFHHRLFLNGCCYGGH